MDTKSYNDLSALFTEQDDKRDDAEFTQSVMSFVQDVEKKRRFILSTLGLVGGLIAGSQIPSLINLGQQVLEDLVPTNMLPTLDISQPSLLFGLVAALFGVFVFWLNALEAA